jgi:hypothetical protein
MYGFPSGVRCSLQPAGRSETTMVRDRVVRVDTDRVVRARVRVGIRVRVSSV